VREKLPFAALAAASATVTLAAQSSAGAMDTYPFAGRVANALRSLVMYLRALVWPADLSAFYPLREVPLPVAAASAALLAAITALAVRAARRQPWILAGWAWSIVGLLPVLGLVQVGAQALADRYTYLSLTGVMLAFVWSVADAARRRNVPALAPAALTAAALVGLTLVTRTLIPFWHDDVVLWSRADRITPDSQRVHLNLGNALRERGDFNDAERYLRAALSEAPGDKLALAAFGALLVDTGRDAEAVPLLEQALQGPQTESTAAMWLGKSSARRGDMEAAVGFYRRALAADPALAPARNELGVLLAGRGDFAEAADQFRQVLRAHPGDAVALHNLARALELAGDLPGALKHYEAALRAEPGNVETRAMRDHARRLLAPGTPSAR
jgi:tetratricopeptide (TPR) repeat protein